jgi:prolipoprotein diacylglyceryltransferase
MIKRVAGFSLLVGLGITLGLGWSVAQAPPRQAERMLNIGVAILLSALAGSRLFYVITNGGYYQSHLVEILWVWEGGLSGAGALVGGCLGLLAAAWKARIPPGRLADDCLPLLAALVTTGWLASWLAGSAYGGVSRAWWALPSLDEWGVSDYRVPVQFYGAVLSAVSLGGLERQRGMFHRAGMAGSLGLCAAAVILLGMSFLRADPLPVWAGLRLDTWGALGALLVAIIVSSICLFSSGRENA